MTQEDDYLFSAELQQRMKPFENMDVREALASPDFFNALLDHAGMTVEEKKEMWKSVGRSDIADMTNE